jgi:hypothetical protein
MFEQMVNYVPRYNLFSPFQSGFGPGHNTMTDLVRVSGIFLRLIIAYAMFILKLRQRYGFQTWMVAFVSSYIFPRQQRIGCGDEFYSLASLVAGVPQGFSISSLCFSLFIDDMADVLEFSKVHMYADDQ